MSQKNRSNSGSNRSTFWTTPRKIGLALWIIIFLWVATLFLRGTFTEADQGQAEELAGGSAELVQPFSTKTATPTATFALETPTINPLPLDTPQVDTPQAATQEPAPTTISTAIPFPTQTSNPPTTTPSPTLTPTPPAEPILYQPQIQNLFCYTEWERFGPDAKINLKWFWNGRLQGNEYLEIRVGPRGGRLNSIGKVFAEPAGNRWEWWITPKGYFLDGTTKEFQWQVAHMTSNGRSALSISDRGCFIVE